ncbi:hypothetical protein CEP51_002510 [Fusarium floridanum]|uniref:Uncharacterized protein n=1 Tax=Fusarium floridanum TaxID=1325733 RepID=A0A428SAW2_9HYPO|nr:hypothetical protein CEP51_002510 [Fusarium floridanum]
MAISQLRAFAVKHVLVSQALGSPVPMGHGVAPATYPWMPGGGRVQLLQGPAAPFYSTHTPSILSRPFIFRPPCCPILPPLPILRPNS